jgi:hypothetical protein
MRERDHSLLLNNNNTSRESRSATVLFKWRVTRPKEEDL